MSTETSNKIVELALEGELEDMRSLVAESLTNLANQIMDEMKIEIAHDYFGQGFSPLMEARSSKDDDEDKDDDDDDDEEDCDDEDEDDMDESAEVNELSKRTLVNYVKKASKDNFTHGFRAGEANGSATKSVRKSINRENGIDKALNRLTKEDAIDERDEGKPGKNFDKIANSAAKEYGSKAAGERVAGAIRAKLAKKHPSEYHESIDETDEVNELSKKTLGSYVKKAASDLDSQSYVGGRLHTPGTLGNKYTKKAYKRVKGIEKATDRLTKEDAIDERDEVNELSSNTLYRYAKKAHRHGDLAARMSQLGDNKEMYRIANKRFAGTQRALDKLYNKAEK